MSLRQCQQRSEGTECTIAVHMCSSANNAFFDWHILDQAEQAAEYEGEADQQERCSSKVAADSEGQFAWLLQAAMEVYDEMPPLVTQSPTEEEPCTVAAKGDEAECFYIGDDGVDNHHGEYDDEEKAVAEQQSIVGAPSPGAEGCSERCCEEVGLDSHPARSRQSPTGGFGEQGQGEEGGALSSEAIESEAGASSELTTQAEIGAPIAAASSEANCGEIGSSGVSCPPEAIANTDTDDCKSANLHPAAEADHTSTGQVDCLTSCKGEADHHRVDVNCLGGPSRTAWADGGDDAALRFWGAEEPTAFRAHAGECADDDSHSTGAESIWMSKANLLEHVHPAVVGLSAKDKKRLRKK